ncbi:TetR/AcrR family transcriptional regulator [Kribbella jiaozuonensis]|uniref:Helix-turn-helix transcriptional regulator n=1 Tax=Kribbella jiaozuonensis TaxID=2575441 RepID=A0A4U3LQV4_9ACTN|nr:TetR/AcrR family transcriptional regulator [Kribbella jiaozuonensis]TKK77514.1 helix-turn-helix transcriptional regulator [Kribbella jiaozuonensis]
MADVKRNYDASTRRERAQQRRRDVVVAAQELFEADGFQATTISAVARRAGVSAESIYKGFGTKAALAKAVFDFVIAGDDEPVPIAERPEALALQQEPDVRRKLQLYVVGLVERQQRSARVQILIRDGRHGDETLRETWQTLLDERLVGMTMFGRHLLETGDLRPGITLEEVADVLWTYISVELYELLVLLRGWSAERYGDHVAAAITTAICRPSV